MTSRPVHLHVGASKTGTSALQKGLFDGVRVLGDLGVGMPLTSRDEHIRHILRPLGWVTASGFVRPVRPGRLADLGARLSATPGNRLLATCEDLCEADPSRIEALVDVLRGSGHDPHVILSVRGLATIIPSEWQQFLKHRATIDYPAFLEHVREGRGRWARHFWLRQDVAAIVRRWSDVVGTDRMDVVVTPPRSQDPEGLYRMFGAVIGFDSARLSWPEHNVNASWGYAEAEVYRRVNVALGGRLEDYERDYQRGVRWPLVQGVLRRGASDRIPLPPHALGWVGERAGEHVAWLEASGIRVHGDLTALLPTEADASPLPELDEAAVARAAIDTLGNLAAFTHRRRRRPDTPAQLGRPGLPARVLRRLRAARGG